MDFGTDGFSSAGPVAQWLEPAAHNGLVAGSSPARPTNTQLTLRKMELGPELFELLNKKQWVGNQTPVLYGVRGLSSAQIASIEAQLGFRVPGDFAYLFQNLQDAGGVFFPWSNFDKRKS